MGNIMGKISQYCKYHKFLDIYYIDRYDDFKDKIIKDKTPEEILEILDLVNNTNICHMCDTVVESLKKIQDAYTKLDNFIEDYPDTIDENTLYKIVYTLYIFSVEMAKLRDFVKDCNHLEGPLFYNSLWKIVSIDDIWETYCTEDLYEFAEESFFWYIHNAIMLRLSYYFDLKKEEPEES